MNPHPSAPRSRSHARWALALVLLLTVAGNWSALQAAPAIPNPSFELNTFANSPGYVSGNTPITSWTASPTDRVGLNPANGSNPFADNGAVPAGTRVAFVQSDGGTLATLSTTITGLVAGTSYRVQFRANCRSNGYLEPAPTYRLNGGAPVKFSAGPAVGGSTDYYTISGIFTATGTTAALEISNQTATDTTLLVDNFTIAAATNIQVTTADNDGPGSLRQALLTAAGTTACNVITFNAALSGKSIPLISPLAVNDTGGVVVDATALSAGITLDGRGGTRLFSIGSGSLMSLRKVTLSGGESSGDGGAILNQGTLSLSQCTLSSNHAVNNGAAIMNWGHADLLQCTLSENTTSAAGANIYSNGFLVLNHCTISGNDVVSAGTMSMTNSIVLILVNFGNLTTAGANIVVNFQTPGSLIGSVPSSADPKLDNLASNGGPAQTMALRPGSPARDAAVDSTISTDQRGKPKVGTADIGAFEIQSGGTFAFSNAGYSVNEAIGSIVVRINRGSAFAGAASVKITTTPGSATAPDFTGLSNQVVNFADGEIFKDVSITLNNDGVDEANETFTATLSGPSAGASLGTPASAKVTLIDPSALILDIFTAQDPNPPVITAPAANATAAPGADGKVMVNGSASDNKGVRKVQIRVTTPGGSPAAFTDCVLDTPDGATTGWSAAITPSVGPTTVEVQSYDNTNLTSVVVSRTFRALSPLAVQVSGNGSVTPGYSPTSLRDVGQKYTVTATASLTPAPGNLFQSWTIVSGHTVGEIGVSVSALEKPTMTFTHATGLILRANFAPNPYVVLGSNSVGVSNVDYIGLVHADPNQPAPAPNGTPRNNSTEGLLSVTLTSAGGFSGKLTIDGFVLNIAGAFDADGHARFGTSRAKTLVVPRTNKPSLIVALDMDFNPGRTTDNIFGTVTATSFQRSVVEAVSNVRADRAFYDGKTAGATVPGEYLGAGGATQSYTVVFPSMPVAKKATAVLYGDPVNDLSIANASPGDTLVFLGAAPIGLSTTEVYTLVDPHTVDHFFLQDSQGNPAPIDDSYDVGGVAFDVALDPAAHQDAGLTLAKEDFAQGDGYGFLTISNAGVVTLTAGKLADGSNWTTFTSKLSKDNLGKITFPLFLQLYAKKDGYLGGDVVLNHTSPSSDFSADHLDWFRAFDITSHYYPFGWTEVIKVGCMGARYASSFNPAGSALRIADSDINTGGDADFLGDPLLPENILDGNAMLSFFDGQLSEELDRIVSISSTNAVTKVPATDTSFALTITGSSGFFKGTFVHENDDGGPNPPAPLTTAFEGVIYQKGVKAGGYGYFLTRKPNPIDYTGESGAVNLTGFLPP